MLHIRSYESSTNLQQSRQMANSNASTDVIRAFQAFDDCGIISKRPQNGIYQNTVVSMRSSNSLMGGICRNSTLEEWNK